MSAPTVVTTLTNPANSATKVSLNAAISITMDQAVNPATALITVTSGAGNIYTPAEGSFLYYDSSEPGAIRPSGSIPDHTFLSMAPASFLFLPGTVYTVTISGVTNSAGQALASPYSFSFTTV
jgi:hypothetical protein